MTDHQAGGTPPADPVSRLRRWWSIIAAVLAVLAGAALALFTISGRWVSEDRPTWRPPVQTSLTESVRVQPVAGWRLSAADVGLPAADSGATEHSKIDATNPPYPRDPFIGYLGDRGYFLATSPGATTPQWWLVGIDVHTGRRLFSAIPFKIAHKDPPECFLNGPAAVLCVHDALDRPTAWVIDAQTGVVSFTGPTTLEAYSTAYKRHVHQVGIYAVAAAMDQGVSGIGPKGEPTWFVPGDGTVDAHQLRNSDLPPQALATQSSAGRRGDRQVVFSVADGTIVVPELDPGAQQETTVVHSGGFVAAVTTPDDRTTRPLEFFDTSGERTSRRAIKGGFLGGWQDVPIVHSYAGDGSNYSAYSSNGGQLAEMTLDSDPLGIRLVGSRLFVSASPNRWDSWVQYDLKTGKQGKTCNVGMRDDYLGSHDSVGVFTFGDADAGIGILARDLDTCETLWRVEPQVGSFRRAWRVNTTVVELSDDGTELFSLVAPH